MGETHETQWWWHHAWGPWHAWIWSKIRVVIIQPRRISEAFGERVGINFQLCDQLILIGSHCRENGFGENKCMVVFSLQVRDGAGVQRVPAGYQMNSGLEPVHGIEDHLK